MKKLSTLVVFAWFFSSLSFSQEELEVLQVIPKKADMMTTDRLGNLYLSKENFIWMYNNQGDSIAAFNSQKYGEVSFIDPTDPYKLLVFFRDYNMIVFLDNYLSENGFPIDLQNLGFDQVVMACKSRESGFWVFDQVRQKVFHLNGAFEITHETVNLSQWFGKAIVPNGMIEYNNKLYLNDNETGVYVFDHFGTFLRKIPIQHLEQFQILEDGINYLDSNQFCQYNFQKFDSNCRDLMKGQVKNARIEKNKLYLLTEDKLTIYRTN